MTRNQTQILAQDNTVDTRRTISRSKKVNEGNRIQLQSSTSTENNNNFNDNYNSNLDNIQDQDNNNNNIEDNGGSQTDIPINVTESAIIYNDLPNQQSPRKGLKGRARAVPVIKPITAIYFNDERDASPSSPRSSLENNNRPGPRFILKLANKDNRSLRRPLVEDMKSK
jgi:hypothetical protein